MSYAVSGGLARTARRPQLQQRDVEFSEDWRDELMPPSHDDTPTRTQRAAPTAAAAAARTKTAGRATTLARVTPPAQQRLRQPQSPPQQEQWLDSSADFTSTPPKSHAASLSPDGAGGGATARGRAGRARLVPLNGDLGHVGPEGSVFAPTGTRFTAVSGNGHRADTTIAPTWSEEHGMHLYNPNQISWANNVPPPHTLGLQVADEEHELEHALRSASVQHDDPDDDGSQQAVYQHSQPQSRTSSRSASRLGYTPQPLQAQPQQAHHLSPTAPAAAHSHHSRPQSRNGRTSGRASPSHEVSPSTRAAYARGHVVAPLGTEFETVYAESRPSDTRAAPTWSEEHGMNLYNPNQISWAGGVPPPGQQGLRARTSSRHASRRTSPTRDLEHDGEYEPHVNVYEREVWHDEQAPSQPRTRSASPAFVAAPVSSTSPPAVRSQVVLDANGRRVVQRFVDAPSPSQAHPVNHQYASTSQVTASSLPPVMFNSATGLPQPVYSAAHGMNLYIPSEISWPGGVPPFDTYEGHFDRGFRQQGAHTAAGVYAAQPAPPTARAPPSAGGVALPQNVYSPQPSTGAPIRSTLGRQVQVEFKLRDLRLSDEGQQQEEEGPTNDDEFRHEGEEGGQAPLKVVRPSSAFRTASPAPNSAPAFDTYTPPRGYPAGFSQSASPPAVRTGAQSRSYAPSAQVYPGGGVVERPSSSRGSVPSEFAPLGTELETVFAEPIPSDTTIAPTWSEEHGMHLYNPNQVSWAGGGAPPVDRQGLRAHVSGSSSGPVRAFNTRTTTAASNNTSPSSATAPVARHLSPLAAAAAAAATSPPHAKSATTSPMNRTASSAGKPKARRKPSVGEYRASGATGEWSVSSSGPTSPSYSDIGSPQSARSAPPGEAMTPPARLGRGGKHAPLAPLSAAAPGSSRTPGALALPGTGDSPFGHRGSLASVSAPPSAAGSPAHAFTHGGFVTPHPPMTPRGVKSRTPSRAVSPDREPPRASDDNEPPTQQQPPPRKYPKAVRMDF